MATLALGRTEMMPTQERQASIAVAVDSQYPWNSGQVVLPAPVFKRLGADELSVKRSGRVKSSRPARAPASIHGGRELCHIRSPGSLECMRSIRECALGAMSEKLERMRGQSFFDAFPFAHAERRKGVAP